MNKNKKFIIIIFSLILIIVLLITYIFYDKYLISNQETNLKNEQINTDIKQLYDNNIEIQNNTDDCDCTNQIECKESNNIVITGGPYIEDNYFYVPQWNYKFKIPDEITSVGFAVDYDVAHVGYELPFIGFTGVLKSDLKDNSQAAYYDNITDCSIITVNKTKKGVNNYDLYEDDIEMDGYVIRIRHNVMLGVCEYNLHNDEVYNLLKIMFQSPEKIN